MGNFDECLDISVESIANIDGIRGQYCTLDIPLKTIIDENNVNIINTYYYYY